MADKDEARWLVRAHEKGGMDFIPYYVYFGTEPQRTKEGYWPMNRRRQMGGPRALERVFPKCYHLKPGGGPVKVEWKTPVPQRPKRKAGVR